MSYEQSIDRIYSEIRLYNGNFGDPIADLVDFDPFELLELNMTKDEHGLGICLLVLFASHIDNSTYEEALRGRAAGEIKESIERKYCSTYPSIRRAFDAALESEARFYSSLTAVYREYVLHHA